MMKDWKQIVLITGIFVSRNDRLVKRFLFSTLQIHFEVETAGNCLVPQGDLDDACNCKQYWHFVLSTKVIWIIFEYSHNSNQPFHFVTLWGQTLGGTVLCCTWCEPYRSRFGESKTGLQNSKDICCQAAELSSEDNGPEVIGKLLDAGTKRDRGTCSD